MACIYLIRGANSAVIWVGQTIDPKRRLREHRKTLGRGIEMEILLIDPTDIAEAERFWIAKYRADGAPLQNRAKGGKGRAAVSDETRAKLSAAGRGKKKPEGFGARLSAITKGRPHVWSEEGRARSAATQLHGPSWLGSKTVSEKLSVAASALTSEERARRNVKTWARLTPEQRSARGRAIAEGQRAARERRG